METTVVSESKEPYERGPHVRYFITAVMIAFTIAVALMGCFVLVLQLLR